MGVQDVPGEGNSAKIVVLQLPLVERGRGPASRSGAGIVAREGEGWRARLWLVEAYNRAKD